MNQFLIMLATNTKVDPSGAANAASAATSAAAGAAPSGGFMSSPMLMVIMYCIVIFGVFYFFSIKPQRKREREMQEMRSKLQVGDSILLNTGMFGKIADITAECYIVEMGVNKSVLIPVLKSEVAMKKEPNLTNKEEEKPEPPKKKGLFGLGKKEETVSETSSETPVNIEEKK